MLAASATMLAARVMLAAKSTGFLPGRGLERHETLPSRGVTAARDRDASARCVLSSVCAHPIVGSHFSHSVHSSH